VQELPSAAIRMAAAGEQRVNLECGRSRFKLLGIPRDEFPTFPAVKFEGGWTVASGDLQKLIGHVAFAASTEESRPILNGVLWELRKDQMRMVATNGHRLARMDVAVSGGSESGDFIVPPKALDQSGGCSESRMRSKSRSENHLGFRCGARSSTRASSRARIQLRAGHPRDNDRVAVLEPTGPCLDAPQGRRRCQ
jgi:DNA polymerase-3 subunit beta